MTPATAQPDTLADVVHALGDIPLHRILWHPFPGTATEEDQIRLVDGDPKRLVELIDGILVEKAMGHRESLLAMWIGTCLNNFAFPRRLGIVAGADGLTRVSPTRNRMPDVAYTAWANLPFPDAHRQSVADFAPDLAVEVISEGNTRAEIAEKRREYFAAGTVLVWVVDPKRETVAVYTDPDIHTVLSATDILDGGDVLPGFSLPVADIFGYLEPPTGN
jgi:Uma2 family endonuclease